MLYVNTFFAEASCAKTVSPRCVMHNVKNCRSLDGVLSEADLLQIHQKNPMNEGYIFPPRGRFC